MQLLGKSFTHAHLKLPRPSCPPVSQTPQNSGLVTLLSCPEVLSLASVSLVYPVGMETDDSVTGKLNPLFETSFPVFEYPLIEAYSLASFLRGSEGRMCGLLKAQILCCLDTNEGVPTSDQLGAAKRLALKPELLKSLTGTL
jgi:hypothetical protein